MNDESYAPLRREFAVLCANDGSLSHGDTTGSENQARRRAHKLATEHPGYRFEVYGLVATYELPTRNVVRREVVA